MMKKLIGVGLIVVLLYSAVACGKTEQENLLVSETTKTQSATTESEVQRAQEDLDAQKEITVYVCGAVKNPGVYQLKDFGRIYEAIEKAGGFSKKAAKDSVNLAQTISDGDMIRVSFKNEDISNQVKSQDGTQVATTGGKVNLNTADVTQLQTLSGIGESKASSIITYRQKNGDFQTVEDIMNVPGIKEGVFAQIQDEITV